MMDYYSWILLVVNPVLLYPIFVKANDDGCSETNFIGCVTRIRLQRVPFDTNMLNVVFNVTTEAKLRQTCIAYTEALPCFRDRILQCGNDKQRRLLDEVAKIIKFFCSSSAQKTQQTFLKHGGCIGKVLQLPATTDCYMAGHIETKKLELCRRICYDKREFLCMMKIWVSEQSLCTLIDTEKSCGAEAGEFYQTLQTSVFTDSFPIICDYSSIVYTSAETVSTTVSSIGEFNTTSLATSTSTSVISTEFIPSTSSTTTSKRSQKSTTITTTTVHPLRINELQHQFNRIVEVTALPPPFEFHSGESSTKSTKPPSDNFWQFESNLGQSVAVGKHVPIVTTSTHRPMEPQTLWRPWYLKGVDGNFETPPTKPPTPSPTEESNVISINELFNFEIFKKQKPTNDVDTQMSSRKDVDLVQRNYGWPLWRNCCINCRLSFIILIFCLFISNLYIYYYL